ncbi:nucleoside recognition domain-containing protein, partial [Turicimonas muris]
MASTANTPKPEMDGWRSEKVTIGNYISLAIAIVFFSGVCASTHWWGIFDFTTLNGGFGKLVSGVSQNADGIHTAMANFRGKGGSGAIDGFMFALTLVPTVMFALAMITIFDHFGALKACRQLLTPILRPLIGVPGSAGLALIASLQSTDGGAALTRQLKDDNVLTDREINNFAAFQMTA